MLASAFSFGNLLAIQHFGLQDKSAPDECCLWLHEAASVNPGPDQWNADDCITFEQNILGDKDMGQAMVIRSCYTRLHELIMQWLKPDGNQLLQGKAVCVVTGTPGIGKSIFQGYMAAKLARETNIVLQRGKCWWSRKKGEEAINHAESKPSETLKDPSFVLLADLLGGDNRMAIDFRQAGCAIIFSLRHVRGTTPHCGNRRCTRRSFS